MAVLHELVQLERGLGNGGEHGTRALAIRYEGLAAAPALELVLLATGELLRVARINGEQHPDSSRAVGAQHQEIPGPMRLGVDLGPIAGGIVAIGVERDPDGWIL